MERPAGITITTILMAAAVTADLLLAWRTPAPAGFSFVVASWSGIGAWIVAAMEAVFLVAYWNGMTWARWLVMIDSFFCLIEVAGVRTAWDDSKLLAGLLTYRATLGLFLLIYLNLDSVGRWFHTKTRANRSHQPPGTSL